ncbi:MAG: sigma-54-dependent Fis family transcriptional regulator [Desulfobacteraceae bacterium]|nr:MAG: sigma-54-dependent Fis family transcriptional regulator [Desulfobacteraceae bacterium]
MLKPSLVRFLKATQFKCDHCGWKPSPGSFLSSIALHGIVFLVGKEDGHVGIVCLNQACRKTTLQKTDAQTLYSFRIGILSTTAHLDGSSDSILRYYSVPYLLDYGSEILPHCIRAHSMELFGLRDSSRRYGLPDEIEESAEYAKGYCSYSLGDRATGPAVEVFWYKTDSIEALLRIENETGRKVFPRYHFHDDLISKIDDFCWEHVFRGYYVASFNENDSFIPMSPDSINPDQKRIKRTYDLMSILDAVPSSQFMVELPSSFATFLSFNPGSAGLFKGPDTEERKRPQNAGARIERMTGDLWKGFTKDHVQNLLRGISDRFISSYINTTRKRTSSCYAIWKLKEAALKMAHGAVKSDDGRRRAELKVAGQQQKEIKELHERFPLFAKIVTQDYNLNQLKLELARLAQLNGINTDLDILLLGERGTGKELFAKAIHQASRATGRKGEFIPVNCANVPNNLFEGQFFGHTKGSFTDAKEDKEGHFAAAKGGTIFLDEIGELSQDNQARFLRVIQEREIQPVGKSKPEKIDVRMIFATNQDLDEMCKEKRFREDLYDRISIFPFHIPCLGERKGDIPLLVAHFINEFDFERKKKPELVPIRVSHQAVEFLMQQPLPGNVREIKNILGGIVPQRLIKGDRSEIGLEELKRKLRSAITSIEKGRKEKRKILPGNMKVEADEIINAMNVCKGNQARAAEMLHVTPKTVNIRWKAILQDLTSHH